MYELTAHEHLPVLLSFALVYGVAGVGLAALAAMAMLRASRWFRRGRLADATVDDDVQLREGDAVLSGVVEHLPDAEHAVRLEVEQDGAEHESSGAWSHKWTEAKREMTVHPFFLVTRAGVRVLVEPTSEVILADALDGVVRIDRTRRVRVAELVPGEALVATGTLVRRQIPGAVPTGYRGAPSGWALVSKKSERMLLSTEPLGDKFRQRARGFVQLGGAALLAFAIIHAVAMPFHLRVFAGRTLIGAVESKRTWETRSDDSTTTHYGLLVRVDERRALEAEVDVGDYERVHRDDRVPLLWVSALPSASSLGTRPTLPFYVVFLMLGSAVLVGNALKFAGRRKWYEPGAKVVDKGTGRLPS